MTKKGSYSNIGTVVGATYPQQLKELREQQRGFILVPGYGAQGGSGKDIVDAFDDKGLGGLVNSSRGITSYYQKNWSSTAGVWTLCQRKS